MDDYFEITKSSKTEVMLRTYRCTKMIFPKCDGFLTITNKRVIFFGLGKKLFWLDLITRFIKFLLYGIQSSLCKLFNIKHRKRDFRPDTKSESRVVIEIDINTISGVSSYYGTKTNIIMLIFGLLSLIMPFPAYNQFRNYQTFWRQVGMHHGFGIEILAIVLVILTIFIGLILLAFCRRQIFYLQIFSSQASGSPITIGEGIGNFGGARAVGALVGKPTPSTDKMMTVLGAIISDIKEMGDHAIELWGGGLSSTIEE